MKKIIALTITLITFLTLLSSCSLIGEEEKRGALDTSGVEVVDLWQNVVYEENRTFKDSREVSKRTFVFDSNVDVEVFRFRAYHTGTYTFSSQSGAGLKVYVHGGNIITDFFKPTPTTYDLTANYEYSIELIITEESFAGQEVVLEITSPNVSEQNITGCMSFVDDWTGETEYYKFVAPVAGEYSFTILNNGSFDVLSGGKVIATTGYSTWSKELPKNGEITIKLKYMHRDEYKTVYGYVSYPNIEVDITEQLKENDVVALKYVPKVKNQSIFATFSCNEDTHYKGSIVEVGVQMHKPVGGAKTYTAQEGYGIITCKIGKNEFSKSKSTQMDIRAKASEKYSIEIVGQKEVDNKTEYYLVLYKNGTTLKYLDYVAN